jgi:hypothetical protein
MGHGFNSYVSHYQRVHSDLFFAGDASIAAELPMIAIIASA